MRKPTLFNTVAAILLAVTFVVVPVELGPVIAAGLNLTGHWAAIGYTTAVVFDFVWLGVLSRIPAAHRQQRTRVRNAAIAVAAAGSAASTTGVALFGQMPFLALVPFLAVAVHGLDLWLNEDLADPATDTEIRKKQAEDRNNRALAEQGERSLAITRSLAAAAHVNSLIAEQEEHDALEAAALAALAHREVRRTRQTAQLEKVLADTRKKHGKAADAFTERGLDPASLTFRLTPPLLGPSVPVAARPVSTTEDADTAVEAARTVVDTELAKALAEAPDDDVMAVAEAAGTVPRPLDATSKISTREDTEGEPGGEVADAASNLVPATPALTDDELYEAGLNVWLALGEPRSQARFLAALKDAGIRASTARKRELHKRLAVEHATA